MNKTIITTLIGGTLALGGGGVIVADQQINPFTDRGDRVEMITISDLPNAGEQKVEVKKDKPQVRFKKWNGEVDLGITYNDVKATGNRPLLSNKMEFKDSKQEVHAYPLTDGFEIEVILKEKPKTNVVSFQLDNWQNLDFFYQPELTQQEIDEGASRPENVVGSYAIYANGKANYCTNCGTPNYGTGKVGHIFRPHIIDSAGTEVWGDLHIENGILSITISQDFLDKAAYPVIVDPTFGYEGTGGSLDYTSNNYILGSYYISGAEAGTITSISANIYSVNGSNLGYGVYKFSDLSLVGYTEQGSVEAGYGGGSGAWKTLNIVSGGNIDANTNYLLAANKDTTSTYLWYDSGGDNLGRWKAQAFGTWPNPLVTPSIDDRQRFIYATYSESAPPASAPDAGIIWFD